MAHLTGCDICGSSVLDTDICDACLEAAARLAIRRRLLSKEEIVEESARIMLANSREETRRQLREFHIHQAVSRAAMEAEDEFDRQWRNQAIDNDKP